MKVRTTDEIKRGRVSGADSVNYSWGRKTWVATTDVLNEFDSFMDTLGFILQGKIDKEDIKEIRKENDKFRNDLIKTDD